MDTTLNSGLQQLSFLPCLWPSASPQAFTTTVVNRGKWSKGWYTGPRTAKHDPLAAQEHYRWLGRYRPVGMTFRHVSLLFPCRRLRPAHGQGSVTSFNIHPPSSSMPLDLQQMVCWCMLLKMLPTKTPSALYKTWKDVSMTNHDEQFSESSSLESSSVSGEISYDVGSYCAI